MAVLFLLILAAPTEAAPPPVLEGRVTRVADGDTLDLLDDAKGTHRIRLLGIDAPEGGQPYGKVARQVLLDKAIQRRVKVVGQSRDRYGRIVGKVLLEGQDLNLALVREGLAWHYKHYANDQFPGDARLYAQAEDHARQTRKGLWSHGEPLAPWVWRRTHRRRE